MLRLAPLMIMTLALLATPLVTGWKQGLESLDSYPEREARDSLNNPRLAAMLAAISRATDSINTKSSQRQGPAVSTLEGSHFPDDTVNSVMSKPPRLEGDGGGVLAKRGLPKTVYQIQRQRQGATDQIQPNQDNLEVIQRLREWYRQRNRDQGV